MEWRRHFHTSPGRLARIGLASVVLFGVLWALPSIARVDFLKPRITGDLQAMTGCSISLGHVYIRALPQPGLVATELVVTDPAHAQDPLLKVQRVGLHFYASPLLVAQLRIRSLSLNAPELDVRHWKNQTAGGPDWTALPSVTSSTAAFPLEGITVQHGDIRFIDETVSPALRASLHDIDVRYDLIAGRGTLEARDPALGTGSRVLLTYDKNLKIPLHLLMGHISTHFLTAYWPAAADWLNGSLDLEATGRSTETSALPNHAIFNIQDWHVAALPAIILSGRVMMSTEAVHINLRTQGASPESYLDVKSPWPRGPATVRASLDGLSPEIAPLLSFSSWLMRLRDRGHIDLLYYDEPRSTINSWQATGRGFLLDGTALRLIRIACSNDAQALKVQVDAASPRGAAHVNWIQPSAALSAALTIDAGSVTVRDILQVMAMPTTTPTPESHEDARHVLPDGYQDFFIQSLHFESSLTPGQSFDITNAQATVEGGRLEASGGVDLTRAPFPVTLHGAYHAWPVQTVAGRFASGSPIISGTGEAAFNLQFNAGPAWLNSLAGIVTLQLTNGTLFEFKNAYRIESLIDLSNYFKLRAPDVAARGIPFDQLSATLSFTRGVMSSSDAFLGSPDMKITAHGKIDWPARRIDATVEFQALHFVEDVITHLPGLHWIFKNGHKILLPIPIHLEGPLDDVSVS